MDSCRLAQRHQRLGGRLYTIIWLLLLLLLRRRWRWLRLCRRWLIHDERQHLDQRELPWQHQGPLPALTLHPHSTRKLKLVPSRTSQVIPNQKLHLRPKKGDLGVVL